MGDLLKWAWMGQMQKLHHKDARSLFRCAGALRMLHRPEINHLVL
jgi:hypothetical protein